MKACFKNAGGILGITLSVYALIFFPSCGGGGTSTPVISGPGPCDTEITEGKGFLMQGGYFQAQDRYLQCLEKYPDNVTGFSSAIRDQQKMTAEYGFVLSQTLSTVVQLSTSVETLMNTAGGLLGSAGISITQTTSPSLNVIVNDLIYGIILKQADYLRPYLADLISNSPVEPVFQIDDPNTAAVESIPIYLGKNNEVLWLSLTGNLDRGEIELIDSFLAVTQGLSETVLSINFEVDLNAAINAVIQSVAGIISGTPIPIGGNLFLGSPSATSGLELVPLLTSIAAFTLNNSPAFLTLNYSSSLPKGGGPPLLLDAADKIGAGCDGFIAAFDKIRVKGNDDTNPFTIVTNNGKENFRLTFLDPTGVKKVVDIPTRSEFFSATQNVKNSVAATGTSPGANPRVSWSTDLSWLVSYGAMFLLQTGGVSALMDITVAKISPSLSSTLQGTINSLTGAGTSALSPDLIQGVILSVIPDAIQLDLGYFYHNPKDRFLRDVIPYWTDFKNGTGNGYLVLEYECPIPTTLSDSYPLGVTAYTCPAGMITDAGHFANLDANYQPAEIANLPGSIPADELLASLPYLAWQDPTLNHLLFLNLNNVGCATCPPSFDQPGLWEFNYFTIKLIGSLLSLLQSLGGLT
ncbi:MAG: hypothetical protein NT056_05190 [Proteobacteria bacterium]|nr:hypothetical protein [Pseudomonadota bacterium]